VSVGGGVWALDWWIGADDRWHLPSREAAVRQSLVGGAPVVETAMRVPGGDLVHRVWAARDSVAGEVVVVEIENASRLPVAVALSIRPYGPDGAAGWATSTCSMTRSVSTVTSPCGCRGPPRASPSPTSRGVTSPAS
jgi:hypothetical protein